MPCNLYGPYDNFHSKNSHFIPALIKKFIEAKRKKKVWLKYGDQVCLEEK